MMSTSSGRCLTVFRLRRPMDIFGSVSFSSSKSSNHLRGKSKSGSFHNIDDCLASFNLMLHSNPPSPIKEFSKLFSALVRMKHYATVISLSKQMEMFGISHNIYSFNVLINCFCHLDCVDFGYSLMGKIFKLGFQPTIVTFNTLIHGLCRVDKFGEAVDLFDDIVEKGYPPDVYTYNVIVNGLCKIGKTNVAFGVLKRMVEEGCLPDLVSYSAIIDSLCKDTLVTEALDLFFKIKSEGILPDVVTYSTLIRVKLMMQRGIETDVITYNSLMDGYCVHNEVDQAREIFDMMTRQGCAPTVVTYSILIRCYFLLYVACVKQRALGLHAGKVKDANELFSRLPIEGLYPDVCTYNTMVNGLRKEGLFDEALKVFKEMEGKGCLPISCSYNAITQGYLRHNDLSMATELIDEMVGKGFSADATTVELVVNNDVLVKKLLSCSKSSQGVKLK
ncbi:hypothetical protein JCGZ_22913 [Jatropha curcas]|uniref:Pentacotripeptide-repeat region of PRORP domain-containing protein n=1 Tax=Jatropha curcas TaxID=180498 RepID=A0A067LJ61_JATCU|nr:hypothetical protein JCGZ_22913 [Jatropha curcas]